MEGNTYHLYVHFGGEDGEKSAVAGNQSSEKKEVSYADKSARSAQRAIKHLVSYASVAATADKLIGYEISQVELKTGAREYEQKLQFGYGIGKKVAGTGVAIGLGIASGNLPAVAIGLVASGINKLISIGQNYNTLKTKENLENVSIDMANVRAGTAGRRGANQ